MHLTNIFAQKATAVNYSPFSTFMDDGFVL